MEQVNWKYFAGIFGIPNMSVQDKIKEFEKSFSIVGKSTSVYSKILCYLAYRCLDGSYDKQKEIEEKIDEHLILLLTAISDEDKAIWTQSLNAVKCYLNIAKLETEKAKKNARDSIQSYSVELNPGGIVNVIRMYAILYAMEKNTAYFNGSERLFKESVSKFEITKESPWLVNCITKAAKSLEILSIMQKGLDVNHIFNADTENPYNKSLRIILSN
jgi:hypothetical protein